MKTIALLMEFPVLIPHRRKMRKESSFTLTSRACKGGFTLISGACKGGFTLIELLVVLFIIGILAGVLFPNFMSARERARDAQRKQGLQQVKNALRFYYNDNQGYPDAGTFSFGSGWSDYMSQVPQDPLGSDNSYGYCVSSDNEAFRLWADLENVGDADIGSSQTKCPALTGEVCTSSCDADSQNCYYVCVE